MTHKKIFRAWDKSHYIYSNDADISFWKWVAYDSTTVVEQWIGLNDINGKPIFEGDIVKFHAFTVGLGPNMGAVENDYNDTGKIVFRPDFAMYVIETKDQDWCIDQTSHHEEPCLEIIGNSIEG